MTPVHLYRTELRHEERGVQSARAERCWGAMSVLELVVGDRGLAELDSVAALLLLSVHHRPPSTFHARPTAG